jgi:hypothetical protein
MVQKSAILSSKAVPEFRVQPSSAALYKGVDETGSPLSATR